MTASKPTLWFLLSLLSAGSMAFYVTEIWGANQSPGFNDLYARWWGAHELLLHGRDPYSPEVSHEIQSVIYGAPLPASAQDPSGIGGGFAYPPYIALLLWPTIYLSFPAAQKLFLSASILATLLSFAVWMHLLQFRWSAMLWITLAVFTVGSFPSLQAIELQNPSLIAAGFIAMALFFVYVDGLVPAGILLAASTIKPQFAIALIPWLVLWATGDWRRRRALIWSFLVSMLLLGGVSEWLVPGWIPKFLYVVRAYRQYAYGHSLLEVWFTPTWGPLVAAGLLIAAIVLSWPYRSQPASSPRFFLVTSLLLAATLVIIPTLAPHAQVLLLPGVLCLVRGKRLLQASGMLARLLLAATWTLLAWPFCAAAGLMVASIWLSIPRLVRFWEVPLFSSPLLPLAVLLALACLLLAPAEEATMSPW